MRSHVYWTPLQALHIPQPFLLQAHRTEKIQKPLKVAQIKKTKGKQLQIYCGGNLDFLAPTPVHLRPCPTLLLNLYSKNQKTQLQLPQESPCLARQHISKPRDFSCHISEKGDTIPNISHSTPQCTAPGRQQHHLFLSCSLLSCQSHTDTLYFSDKFSSWQALSNNNLERSHHSHSCLESSLVTSFLTCVSWDTARMQRSLTQKFVPPK